MPGAAPADAATSPVPFGAGSGSAIAAVVAASPVGDGDDGQRTDRPTAAGASMLPPRLGRAARELRSGPLSVDLELAWMFDDAALRRTLRVLRDSSVPMFVAVLPTEDEDESGGDTRRVLQSLQRAVGRPGVYVTVDPRGRFDLASVGVPRSLEISFGLLSPPRDGRPYEQQQDDPRPPGWASVPDRLATIVAAVDRAGPGTPNEIVDRVRPLEPVDRTDHRAERNREDAIAAASVGLVLGLVLALCVFGVRGAVRAARNDASAAARRDAGPPGGRGSTRGQRTNRRRGNRRG